jgi:apolipoprotein N-acyltransferase
LHVVIVQPNIDPYNEAYDLQAENRKLQKFTQLADSKIKENTDLVIGPETVFERYPDWNVNRLESNYQFRQLTDWMWNHPKAEIIFGTSSSKIYPDAESASFTARHSNGVYYDVFNSAVFINRNGKGMCIINQFLFRELKKCHSENTWDF